MSLVLILTHIVRFILKPLKQPKVISDVLAGIIFGPSVLGHNNKIAANITPQNSQFVVQNIGIMGFMYWLFVTGVKKDLTVIAKVEKRHWVIALSGIIIPHIVVRTVALLLRQYMDEELRKYSSLGGIISCLAISSFPVCYSILRDMQLLSSELGRLALLTVIITDIVGINIVAAFEAMKQGDYKAINTVYYTIAVTTVVTVIIGGVWVAAIWINRQTPQGEPVEQAYIAIVLVGVFVLGLLWDLMGQLLEMGRFGLGLRFLMGLD